MMPIYESKCLKCNKVYSYIARVSNCTTAMPMCCDKQTKKVILTPPQKPIIENVDWICPATGQHVTSLRKRKQIMAENDLVEAPPIEEYKGPNMPEISTAEILDAEAKAEAVSKGYDAK